MPELPEVERVRADLQRALVGRAVVAVTLHRRDMVCLPSDPPGGFSRQSRKADAQPPPPKRVPKKALLLGATVSDVLRHGKRLAIESKVEAKVEDTTIGPCLDAHLGMTGSFLHAHAGKQIKKADHIHLTWKLDDGSTLVFRDPRRFGGLWTCADRHDLHTRRWASLGPDALSLTAKQLAAACENAKRPIKSLLLDQHAIAGVGNIYADEALFRAGIRPLHRASDLKTEQTKALAKAIGDILRKAVKAGGSTIRDYTGTSGDEGGFQNQHAVYGRGGQPCLTCGHILTQSMVAQRTTVWCDVCQPAQIS